MKVTTPEEFTKKMQQIFDDFGGDEEAAHGEMDDLMCEVLIELGYKEGIEIFDKQEKWYA